MPDAHTLWIFAVASAGLALLPGPAMLYIVTRGVAHGRRGGIYSMLGVEAGDFLQVLAAAAGLAAIVASSAVAFTVVKYAGAVYLLYLGVRALRAGRRTELELGHTGPSDGRLFWEGFLVGALNPKLALFLLAFLPQFVDPSAGPVWLQTLVLGCVLQAIIMVGDTCFALAAGTAGVRLRRFVAGRRISVASGVLYLGLGAYAALGDGRPARGASSAP
jgi:threonine/homoserine/homoserine lactone efflux protein